jgi:hypothetical protein
MLHCMGPSNQPDALTPLRDNAVFAVTSIINTLKPGVTKTIAERYRDLAFRYPPTFPQPQRVWKGLLSASQMQALLDISSITPTTPNNSALVKTIKSIQAILATSLLDIRAMLTTLTYPTQRKFQQTPCEAPSAPQLVAIANKTTKPITSYFPSASTTLRTNNKTFTQLFHSGRTKSPRPIYPRGSRTSDPHRSKISVIPPYIPHVATATHSSSGGPSQYRCKVHSPLSSSNSNTLSSASLVTPPHCPSASAHSVNPQRQALYFSDVIANGGFDNLSTSQAHNLSTPASPLGTIHHDIQPLEVNLISREPLRLHSSLSCTNTVPDRTTPSSNVHTQANGPHQQSFSGFQSPRSRSRSFPSDGRLDGD